MPTPDDAGASRPTLDSEYDLGWLRETLARRKPALLDYRIEYRRTLRSTMDVVNVLGEENLRAGVVLIAGEQVAGIGQNRQKWHSESGSTEKGNVTLTVVLEEAADARQFAEQRIAAALATIDALKTASEHPDLPVKFRGPNDVYSYDPNPSGATPYRKIAGVLPASVHSAPVMAAMKSIGVEKPEPFQLLGFGVNLVHSMLEASVDLDGELRPLSDFATTLETLTGRRVAPEAVIAELLTHLDENLLAVADADRRKEFFTRVQANMAKDAGGHITVELVEDEAGPKVKRAARVLSAGADGLEVELDGGRRVLAFEEIARFYPWGMTAI
jgi:biotin-(acetyl-CoA carboxylase) ligase